MALAVVIIACGLALLYWDVQDIHRAWRRSGDILGVPSSSASPPWKQSGVQSDVQNVDLEDDRWDVLLSDEPSNPLRSCAKETGQNN
jgi:hypothetical protein